MDVVDTLLALHEQTGVPVELSFTTTSARKLAENTTRFEAVKTSPCVAVSYHVRPRVPYLGDCDWDSFASLNNTDKEAIVVQYETEALNLEYGTTTGEDGGYQHLGSLLGYPPFTVGADPAPESAALVFGVFHTQFNAPFLVKHSQMYNLGDQLYDMYVRPQHVEIKLFDDAITDPASAIDSAITEASNVSTAKKPYVVGIKIHDNDFFAVNSAWTTAYMPPQICVKGYTFWNYTTKSDLKDQTARDAMWQKYEDAVQHVAGLGPEVAAVNARHLHQWLQSR